jgi:hypothetical protein
MHDIDLAIERGSAPGNEVTPEGQKKADLANLEFLVSSISEQACAQSDGGGVLKQLREFNAMLQRAASALEVKPGAKTMVSEPQES